MSTFLRNCVKYFVLLTVLTFFLIILTTIICKDAFDYDIPKNKNILIVGDSHTECALNDKILTNLFNLSQSGSGYFYSYLKVRAVLQHNPQIDTVLVGYAYGEMDRDQWFSGQEQLKIKLGDHFFLLYTEDYLDLLAANPVHTLSNTPQVIFHNLENMLRGYSALGGYVHSERDKLEEAKKRHQKLDDHAAMASSSYQEYYLLKIYEYCQSKGVQLVLINVPIHPFLEADLEKRKDEYYSLVIQKMPNVILINHSNFRIPDYGYGDLDHLNYKGAKIYSEYLKQNGFKPTMQQYTRVTQN